MLQQPSKKERWFALGILVSVLVIGYFSFVYPWFTRPLYSVEKEIDGLRDRQLRIRMQIAQAPEVARMLKRAQTSFASESGFLTERSAELASVGLVERLEHTVAVASPNNRGCTITNRSPLQPEISSGYIRVAVQVRLRCGTPELVEILYSLENRKPSLFVDNLNIMAQRYQLSPNDTGNGLDVAFELAGYLHPNQPTAPASTAPPASTAAEGS